MSWITQSRSNILSFFKTFNMKVTEAIGYDMPFIYSIHGSFIDPKEALEISHDVDNFQRLQKNKH